MNHPAHFFDVPPRTGRQLKYPLKFMNLGDSVFLPGVTYRDLNGVRYKHAPKIFMIRTVVECGVKGVRVSCVEKLDPFFNASGRPPKYPFRTMEVGETVLIPGKTPRELSQLWTKLRPRRFTAKTVIIRGEKFARVQRIEDGCKPKPPQYPFRSMMIGESIFVPDATPHYLFGFWKYAKPFRFKGKSTTENGVKGARVWRFA